MFLRFLLKLKRLISLTKIFLPDVDLFDYGYLDSFGVVELLLEIKNVFEVDLSKREDFIRI